jgi:flavin-dependent dehydrogenase
MAQAATRAGARILWNTRVNITSPHTAIIDGKTLSFDWLIGADGPASTIRAGAGLAKCVEDHHRFAVRRHFRVKPWSGFVELHWNRTGQVCLAPVGDECVSAIFMSRSRDALRGDPFASFPELMSRLKGAEIMTAQSGAVLITRRLRRVATATTALIGDASGSVDAITGEGLGMSFRQAVALADCIQSGSLAAYNRRHRAIGRLPHHMGRLLLLLDRYPALADCALATLSRHPASFGAMLNLHLGTAPGAWTLARQAPGFAWTLCATLAKNQLRSLTESSALPSRAALTDSVAE